ncbi:unnamed protein product [Malus baccata var. baccata]
MASENRDSENREFHVCFFPFMAHGHMIPVSDMAKLFASQGVKTTIVTTPLNAPTFSKATQSSKTYSGGVIKTIKFPSVEAGLPEGCENVDSIPSPELSTNFLKATSFLPFWQTCFFPWATDADAKFDIPRLIFHGTCFFALAASDIMTKYEPFKNTSSDSDPFVIPDFPGEENIKNDWTRVLKRAKEAEKTSYGIVVNSFYELESAYADYYRNVLGRKAWHIGPHDFLKWLDSKEPNSVVYVCFGSVAKLNASQLKEIAMGLEASGKDFIWVVRTGQDYDDRMEGKGLIIRGWAPQVLILDHGAVGGFVTHCGWNSTLEGIAAGLPMVTWPVSAEQFYNEKLVTQVLKIGAGVEAVRRIMVGEEAQEMRSRARELAEQAKRAIEKEGSSHSDLNALIEELSSQ